jgi:hypothetical protein
VGQGPEGAKEGSVVGRSHSDTTMHILCCSYLQEQLALRFLDLFWAHAVSKVFML